MLKSKTEFSVSPPSLRAQTGWLPSGFTRSLSAGTHTDVLTWSRLPLFLYWPHGFIHLTSFQTYWPLTGLQPPLSLTWDSPYPTASLLCFRTLVLQATLQRNKPGHITPLYFEAKARHAPARHSPQPITHPPSSVTHTSWITGSFSWIPQAVSASRPLNTLFLCPKHPSQSRGPDDSTRTPPSSGSLLKDGSGSLLCSQGTLFQCLSLVILPGEGQFLLSWSGVSLCCCLNRTMEGKHVCVRRKRGLRLHSLCPPLRTTQYTLAPANELCGWVRESQETWALATAMFTSWDLKKGTQAFVSQYPYYKKMEKLPASPTLKSLGISKLQKLVHGKPSKYFKKRSLLPLGNWTRKTMFLTIIDMGSSRQACWGAPPTTGQGLANCFWKVSRRPLPWPRSLQCDQ